ncbi:MAG: UDP-N-acetylglucosamine 1-carboxyvinyltransferase [Nitrospiraceae bacterium]|nr:UDP-N-acetylglucosamine 1-carboxyvinyltransferase [Nitrospiraceae bacterium]
MDRFRIEGRQLLNGMIPVSGSKNAALPILFSTLLGGNLRVGNIPHLRDITTAIKLLVQLGVQAESIASPADWTGSVSFSEMDLSPTEAPYDLVRVMRASILCLGPLLSRRRRARVSLPGGCLIGARPVDLHLHALQKMGARISIDHGYIDASTDGLVGCDIHLSYPTVTGTENILMAAVLASGTTRISNAAQEPEIADLANCLVARGAKISGIGSSVLEISGVAELRDASYDVMFDRIEAGTFLVAGALMGDPLTVSGVVPEQMSSILATLGEMGAEIEIMGDRITLSRVVSPQGATVMTDPYPGFPTDMQAQILPLMATATGPSTLIETVFESRFTHVMEMNRMGANIEVRGSHAFVRGECSLEGACVMASDLRASAGLVLAGLVAHGETVVQRVYHIDRGYERIEEKLSGVGGRIWRESEEV